MTDGIANNIVYNCINDQEGNLWISTKNGLTKYIPRENMFIKYSVSEGLPTNEFVETRPFISNDTLFYGTIKGIVYFNPKDLLNKKELPEILFTDLQVSNMVVEVSKEGPLNQDINLAEKIILRYNQNNFSISYSTNDFQQQASLHFEYMLDNLDKKWLKGKKNQSITYTNIPPGSYTLKLRLPSGMDEDLLKLKTLKVIISPPYWRTWWAYLAYCLLFVALVVLSVKLFQRFNTLRNSLRL